MGAIERFAKRQVTDSENPSAETIWQVWIDETHPTIADEVAAYAIVFPLLPCDFVVVLNTTTPLAALVFTPLSEV